MIEDPPLLRVKRNFTRPDPKLVRALQHVPTGFVVDCMNGRGALDARIKPIDLDHCRIAGPALTCNTGPDDNLGLLAAINFTQPGDIIVNSTGSYTNSAVTGDIIVGMLRNRGAAGLVTDGMVRDEEGILVVGLPVFCRGITPNSCVKNGPGTVGMPVSVDGVPIESGDVIIGDRDGVVVIPRAELAIVCQRLVEVKEAEARLTRQVRMGLQAMESVTALLESERTQYLD